MSLSTTLLNLRILSKVSGGGRIAKSSNGIISLEEPTVYLCIKRWLSWDSRQQTLLEIKRILEDATEKAMSMLNSRYMSEHSFPEEFAILMEDLKMLYNGLCECVQGLHNLRITYCQDHSTIAQIDLMLVKVNTLLLRMKPYLPTDMLAEKDNEHDNVST